MIDRRSVYPLLPVRTMRWVLVAAFVAPCLFAARFAGAQEFTATASVRRLPVALHAIPRGTVLTADDFAYRDSTTRIIPDANQVAPGWVTRRTIASGEVLREPAIEPPDIVTANDPVEVEWADQNVTLTVRGIAARSGALGERIPVRTELGKRLEGTIVGPGRVRID